MKKHNSILVLFIAVIMLIPASSESQNRKRVNSLLDLYGQTAYSYFLSANRPGFGVDAYTLEKGKGSISAGISYGDEVIDIPVSFSYGITDNLEISGGLSPFTESYNFAGSKISGLGDSYTSLKYSFLESDHFIHAFQFLVKLPTASSSKELGTGKTDLCFGLAQAYAYRNFGYDLSIELNLLNRRDFPSSKKYPPIIQNKLDSVKSQYNYTFEPELVISGGPSFEFSKYISGYAGYSFQRNTRLNYNSSSIYGGFGFVAGKRLGISIGGSYGLEEAGTWGVSGGLNYSLF
ncbi:MAG TPA: hypothetical protein PKA39_00880 [Ignavibacteria bacterium]|jgi:hypothetical protein|nr:hypothetical protein [Ignavibacteria bacterium]